MGASLSKHSVVWCASVFVRVCVDVCVWGEGGCLLARCFGACFASRHSHGNFLAAWVAWGKPGLPLQLCHQHWHVPTFSMWHVCIKFSQFMTSDSGSEVRSGAAGHATTLIHTETEPSPETCKLVILCTTLVNFASGSENAHPLRAAHANAQAQL
eukprot:scaffold312646_cov22-Tisochrysis_lutea.AAC.1